MPVYLILRIRSLPNVPFLLLFIFADFRYHVEARSFDFFSTGWICFIIACVRMKTGIVSTQLVHFSAATHFDNLFFMNTSRFAIFQHSIRFRANWHREDRNGVQQIIFSVNCVTESAEEYESRGNKTVEHLRCDTQVSEYQ